MLLQCTFSYQPILLVPTFRLDHTYCISPALPTPLPPPISNSYEVKIHTRNDILCFREVQLTPHLVQSLQLPLSFRVKKKKMHGRNSALQLQNTGFAVPDPPALHGFQNSISLISMKILTMDL